MERNIENKTIVLTGGAVGIGYHIADNFLINHAKKVVILDINEILGQQAAESLNNKHGENKAVFIKCDVTKDLDEVSKEIFKNFEVDVLINNAGICDERAIRKTIEVNLIAVIEWSFKFFDYMRKDLGGRGGTIFNVVSYYGYKFDPWIPIYKSSKHGAIGFTKTLGHPTNYEKSGVRVISICPGFTKTDLISDLSIADYQKEGFNEFAKTLYFQSVESVGKASVEIFKVADSSTSWEIKDDKPIKEVEIYKDL